MAIETSRAIDTRLRELVEQALSVYLVDDAALAKAHPEVILTQDLCDVCAVSYEETCRAARSLAHTSEIVSTHPTNLAEIWDDIQRIGEVIGYEQAAVDLIAGLRARVEDVRRRSSPLTHPPVLTLEWIDPPMPGGLWMAELVELAGGLPLGDQAGSKTAAFNTTALLALSPEVLVVKPCGFKLEQGLAGLAELQAAIPWDVWPACRENRVYIADGNAYFNRPGPRIVDSLELLAGCIHPAEFNDFRQQYAGSVAQIDPNLNVELW